MGAISKLILWGLLVHLYCGAISTLILWGLLVR